MVRSKSDRTLQIDEDRHAAVTAHGVDLSVGLKLSWTIADLAGSEGISHAHLPEEAPSQKKGGLAYPKRGGQVGRLKWGDFLPQAETQWGTRTLWASHGAPHNCDSDKLNSFNLVGV